MEVELLNYRGETLTGQTGVRKGRRKCPGLTGTRRVDQACLGNHR